jgi:hypothetical protein
MDDVCALQRLAALDSRTLPAGRFLLAEVRGELIAAAPLDADAAPLANPFWFTAQILAFLELQADGLRRSRENAPRGAARYVLRLRAARRPSTPGDFAGATSNGGS